MPPAAAAAIAPRRVAFPTFPRSVSLKWFRISAHVAISLFPRPRRPSRQSHQSLVVANRASAVVVVVVAAAAEVEGKTANAANAVSEEAVVVAADAAAGGVDHDSTKREPHTTAINLPLNPHLSST